MLSSLKPANGKFVLGPPVETAPPVVVFTGPADHPDSTPQTASASPKKKRKIAAKSAGEKAATGDKPSKPAQAAKPAKPKVLVDRAMSKPEPNAPKLSASDRRQPATPIPLTVLNRFSRRRQDHAAQPALERSGAVGHPPSSSTNSARSRSTICWSSMSATIWCCCKAAACAAPCAGDLVDALEQLLRDLDNRRCTFKRVLLETTGLADPAPVLHTMMAHPYLLLRYRLDGVVTVGRCGQRRNHAQ